MMDATSSPLSTPEPATTPLSPNKQHSKADDDPRRQEEESDSSPPPAPTPWFVDLIVCVVAVLLAVGACALGNTTADFSDPAKNTNQNIKLGFPLFTLVVIVAFALNWIMFIPAFLLHTEKFYDLTGSIGYLSCTLIAVGMTAGSNEALSWRAILLGILVVIWCLRLGFFLFRRVLVHTDTRFAQAKFRFFEFLKFWTLQGLWTTLTASAAFAAIVNDPYDDSIVKKSSTMEVIGIVSACLGGCLWVTGFLFEVIADEQKWRFKAEDCNKGKFISSGLWSISRHPNYAGEVTLWIGVALIAWPGLNYRQLALAVISPSFVFLLIRFASGVPLLEKAADKRWGGQSEYERYKSTTPVFWPMFRCSCCMDPAAGISQ